MKSSTRIFPTATSHLCRCVFGRSDEKPAVRDTCRSVSRDKSARFISSAIAVLLLLGIPAASWAKALPNDASILDAHWDHDQERLSDFTTQAGSDGPEPTAESGNLTLSMDGAIDGGTFVARNLFADKYFVPSAFVITTLTSVRTFPEEMGSANAPKMTIADVRADDRVLIGLSPTAVFVAGPRGGTVINNVTTEDDTFYIWQIQVSQKQGVGNGTVTIYRRTDETLEWTLIAADIPILDFDPESQLCDQAYLGAISYSTTGSQGMLQQKYFTMGTGTSAMNQ